MLIGILTMMLAALAAGAAGALVYGTQRTRARAEAVAAHLEATRVASGGTYREAELEGLPAPVVRYFRAVLRDGQPIISGARFAQRGAIRTGETEASGWRPFTATEHFVSRPPGFAWVARVRMAPGLAVHVRDAYVGGAGSTHAEMLGLFTVASAHGTPEMAAGALQRYLAEAPWLPTALLPSQGVAWTAIDDTTARATLTDGATTVSMDFGFSPAGEIVTASTPARYRAVKGAFELAPWGGRFASYAEWDGVRIPQAAEVAWVLDGRRFPYWRGRITRVEYQTAPR